MPSNPEDLRAAVQDTIRVLEVDIAESVGPRRSRGLHLCLWMLYLLEEDLNRSIRAVDVVKDFSRDFSDLVLPVLRIIKAQAKDEGSTP